MMLVSRLCQGPLGGRRETSTDDRNNRWHQQSLSYNETPWSFQGNSPHSCRKTHLFLEAAPNAQVAHTAIGCMVSIDDLADRPPVPMAPDGSIDLGGRRIRSIDTPHVPHGW